MLWAAGGLLAVTGAAVADLVVTMPPGVDTGTDVTVARPGTASGDDGGSLRTDLDLGGATPPAGCTALPQTGMPFDGGGDWPDRGGTTARVCDGWVTVVLDDRLYAWTDDALRADS